MFPEDRPEMSSVVFMLVNEGLLLPQPKQLGFFTERGFIPGTTSSSKEKSHTRNAMSITTQDGRGETSNSDIPDGDTARSSTAPDNIYDFDDADDIRDDFDGSCTTPATPPTVPFNHASNSSLQSRFEGPPGVRTQRHESVIQSFQELRNEFKDFESRVQDRLEIVLDELRDSNRRREEEHAELMRIFRSYRHNDDQSHTPLGHSLSMSQYARSYHPFDPPVGLQNSAEVQDPPVVPQNSAEVQDPLVGQQNSAEVQDPPAGQQNSAEVQDPPVNCRPVRLRKRGWQQTTPYTDPCKPKRAKSASHKFKPDEKVDAEVLADYVAFKEEPNGAFGRLFEDSKKRQRMFPDVSAMSTS
ncbi:hypothetical protein LWI29_023706 [Acer saccharum]|uniref:Uncharacterized protein n=1 Tax=Acer saccharum TaxID=4024 RepID=A0AA39T566_ACESA|nr:hypothetical protein LWI29_023706 [Acer saccharum]